ncbi:related to phospholipid-translocating ATPase [Cephalotrichum gorgonifer]|uniref:Related to phospholipid-translocating ATPase n=1 Tax=Cephalotrichum gorgonifer TaxID=2041049 RepID=A0AAE8MXS6_9PEZI|nr:related to phospholipid-translocating ATPase [Cephalotrichum gorgonifer]
MDGPPPNLVAFGPDANCTLEICPVEWSVYRYVPSLPANIVFAALFALAGLVHVYLGIRWRQWTFMGFMLLGCIVEIVGYAGRIMMHSNPFDFVGFMTQIALLTFAPVFYSAAIYITLSKTIIHYSPSISRLKPPTLYIWIFIPADVVCLVLQAAGGALSSSSTGNSQTGIDLALAGLSLQVIVIVAFILLFADHIIRHQLLARTGAVPAIPPRTRVFIAGLSAATLLILARCSFRCYELQEGYSGEAVADEALFIGLEGVPVVLAAFALAVGHPGLVFGRGGAPAVIDGGEAQGAAKGLPMTEGNNMGSSSASSVSAARR